MHKNRQLSRLVVTTLLALGLLLPPNDASARIDEPPPPSTNLQPTYFQCPGAPFIVPSGNYVSANYHYCRGVDQCAHPELGYHQGIDIKQYENGQPVNTPGIVPVYAAYEGVVDLVGNDPVKQGLFIRHTDVGGQSVVHTYYAHMANASRTVSYIVVGEGQRVAQGQLIGYQGNYGASSVHLHFSVSYPYANEYNYNQDPSPFLGFNVDGNNGAQPGYITYDRCYSAPDTTPPTKASNVRPNGWSGPYTSDTTPSFRWDPGGDDGSGIAGYYVAVDDWTPDGGYGNDWWVGDVTAFTVPDALPDDEHVFAVTSKDNAGNVNPANTNQPGDAPYYTFYVDTTAPTNPTTIHSGCNAQNNVWQNTCADPIFTWSGANDHGGSGIQDYHIYWGPSPKGLPNIWRSAASYDPDAVIPLNGIATYHLRLSTRDNVGNESDAEIAFILRYDVSIPTADPVIANGADTVHALRVNVEPNAQDTGSGLNTIHLSNDRLAWRTEPYAARTTWTLELLNRQLQTVYLEMEDKAGNRSSRYSCWLCLDLYPAHPSSAGYRLWGAGPIAAGSRRASSQYHLASTAGQSAMGGDLHSTHYRLRSGFQALLPARPGAEMFTPFSCRRRIYLPVTLRGK